MSLLVAKRDGIISDHGTLSGLSDDDHSQYILHSLADAANDFLVASGADVFVKKTLAETGAILEADINHDNLVGYVADEHVAHSGVTLTAGVGLSGGGDITVNRTFTVDLDELTTETSIAAGDFIPMVDITDSGSGKITFANIEATLNHGSLTGFVADEHVAHTSVTLTAGAGLTGTGDISASRTFDVVAAASGGILVNADSVQLDINSLAVDTIAAGDFVPFEDIGGGLDNKLTFANFEGTLNHDNLTGFVANEHIDHTSVTLTAGAGLTGTGDISASRTFDVVAVASGGLLVSADDMQLDINSLAETGIAVGDFLAFEDIGGGLDKKISFTNLEQSLAIRDFFNGTFAETFDALVTSDGATITCTVTNSVSGDLTSQFSSGDSTFTGGSTIALTAGSDASPQSNYIYILESAPTVLVKSTSDWPATEHIKVSYFLVPSAGFTQTNGVYINQNWNDHLSITGSQGHLSHITERSRRLGAIYKSGIDGNGTDGYLTPTAGNVELKATAGVIFQMHKHSVAAFDTSGTDTVLIKNWSGDAYHDITNLYDITADNTGSTITNNKYFNLTIWGVANKGGEYTPTMINLPGGSYNTQAGAEADTSSFNDDAIPDEFNTESTVGFLIARVTIKMKTGGGTWEVTKTVDLRKEVAGSAGSAPTTTNFVDNTFTIEDESDPTKVLAFDVGTNVTTATTRTLIIPDTSSTILTSDGTTALGGAWDMGSQILTNVNIDTGDIATAVVNTEWDAAFTHVSNDGSDHSFIDQSVVSGANVTFGTVDANTDFTVGGTVITDNTITDDGTLVLAPTTAVSFSDKPITNVSDIALKTISSDDSTDITVTLGTDAGDDFIIGNNSALVVEGDNDAVGIRTAAPTAAFHIGPSGVQADALMKLIGTSGATICADFDIRNDADVNGAAAFRFTGRMQGNNTGMRGTAYDTALIPGANIAIGYGMNVTVTQGAVASDMTNVHGMTFQVKSAAGYTGATSVLSALTMLAPSLAGTKPSTNYGLFVQNQGVAGVTNTKGLIINAQTGSTNNWNIHSEGAATLNEFEGEVEIGGDITHTGTNVGLFSATPVNQAAGMTAQLTSITHTAPGTPDYALQALVDSGVGSAWGFATSDEGNTLLSVVLNLQVRVAELEAMLDATTGIGVAA